MHIAKESKDIEVFERVSEQKYSLDNLIEMLMNYSDDEVIDHYLTKLEELRTPFDLLDNEVKSDFDTDTREGKSRIERILTMITELQKDINEIRSDIIA